MADPSAARGLAAGHAREHVGCPKHAQLPAAIHMARPQSIAGRWGCERNARLRATIVVCHRTCATRTTKVPNRWVTGSATTTLMTIRRVGSTRSTCRTNSATSGTTNQVNMEQRQRWLGEWTNANDRR